MTCFGCQMHSHTLLAQIFYVSRNDRYLSTICILVVALFMSRGEITKPLNCQIFSFDSQHAEHRPIIHAKYLHSILRINFQLIKTKRKLEKTTILLWNHRSGGSAQQKFPIKFTIRKISAHMLKAHLILGIFEEIILRITNIQMVWMVGGPCISIWCDAISDINLNILQTQRF